jgi:hypothetical protein
VEGNLRSGEIFRQEETFRLEDDVGCCFVTTSEEDSDDAEQGAVKTFTLEDVGCCFVITALEEENSDEGEEDTGDAGFEEVEFLPTISCSPRMLDEEGLGGIGVEDPTHSTSPLGEFLSIFTDFIYRLFFFWFVF